MTKVWFVREGSDPTQGEPQYDLPFEQCIEQLGLTKHDWLHGLDRTPHFQAPRRVAVPEHRHVVCQVDDPEASEWRWMAGYYVLELGPKEVARRLGPPVVG